MQYVQLDRIPRPVSRLVFGCAFPAMIAGEDQSPLLDRAFAALVHERVHAEASAFASAARPPPRSRLTPTRAASAPALTPRRA